MDYNQLVDEILTRVALKIASLDEEKSTTNQKRALILTEEHGIICHELLEHKRLQSYCHVDCALYLDYQCDLVNYDTVIIYNFTNQVLSKLAGGILDTPLLSLASKAILMGKRILIPTEEIELYRYEKTAPKAYYVMMSDKLKLLQESGVMFCPAVDLEKILTGNYQRPEAQKVEVSKGCETRYAKIEKKIVTEKDIKTFTANGINSIGINSNAILTDLAKEYLNTRGIRVERENSSGRKQG